MGLRLYAARRRGNETALSQVERLLAPLPAHCRIITVIDGHPATLAWLGSVAGHKTVPLGVEHFVQEGRIDDLYANFGLDGEAMVYAASMLSPGRKDIPMLLFP